MGGAAGDDIYVINVLTDVVTELAGQGDSDTVRAMDPKTGKIVWEAPNNAPLWGGDVAKKVNYLEQGGSVWVFKLMK